MRIKLCLNCQEIRERQTKSSNAPAWMMKEKLIAIDAPKRKSCKYKTKRKSSREKSNIQSTWKSKDPIQANKMDVEKESEKQKKTSKKLKQINIIFMDKLQKEENLCTTLNTEYLNILKL